MTTMTTIINWNNMKVSGCQTFLEVADMKFMATENISCSGCYFLSYQPQARMRCNENIKCIGPDRKDNRNIIWMRIL